MTNDDTDSTVESTNESENGSTDTGVFDSISRRSVLKAAGAGALTLGFADSFISSVSAVGIPTPWLHRDGNLIKDPSDNTVILRG
ncbi:twin-arginine translocation signal domain-containing protein [Halocatena marina]